MFIGLNFYRFLFTVFLAFVSILVALPSFSQTSGQAKDEFSIFEDEIKGNSTKTAAPEVTPPSSAAPAAKPVTTEKKSLNNEDKIEQLKKDIRANPKNINLIGQLAEEFYKRQEYDKTTVLLWKYVDKMPRPSLVLLAKAHEKRNEPSEMMRAANILIGKDPKDYEAYTLLGAGYALGKKPKDAMESFKKALEFNSRYEPAYDGLIKIYNDRNPPNLYELRILYQDMIEQIGRRTIYLRKLCEINAKDSTFEAAVQVCKEAIQKDSQAPDPYVYLAISYSGMGEEKQAETEFKKAAQRFPQSELAQYQYGKILEDQKNYVAAMKIYKTGTEADPKAGRSWLGLANSAFEIRKYDIALLAYKNACKYDKKNAVAFRRATTVLRNNRNSEWIGKYESASENCTF